MKRIVALAAVTLLAAGCHNNPPASQSASDSGTLTPPPAAPTALSTPTAQPAGYEAAPTPIANAIDTSTPDGSAPLAASGGTYTVQHGDTLYHIALKKYGDGKAWKRIAAANPGVNPAQLKVGQTLVLP